MYIYIVMDTSNIMGVTASQVHRAWGALDFASRRSRASLMVIPTIQQFPMIYPHFWDELWATYGL
jgi:hypothetical protein